MTEDDDVGTAFLLFVGEEPAFFKIDVIDQRLLLGVALEHRVGELVAVVLDGEAAEPAGRGAVLLRGIDGEDVRQIAEGDRVFVGKLAAGEHLLCGAVAEDWKAEDPEDVGAERLDEVVDVVGEAIDDRGDEDDGGDADHDAEDGEAGAQLVRAQRIHRHPHRLFSVTPPHGVLLIGYNSARKATMGSSLDAFRAG